MSKYNEKDAPRWDFMATSITPRTTPLRMSNEVADNPPRVIYTTEVWQKLRFLIAHCDKEVGWLGYVEAVDGDYLITDIFIPPQTVSGVTTEIENEDMADIAVMLMDEGRDPSKLIYWGHSHVNMGVSPSDRDEVQLEEYIENCPIFIRGIYNKRGEQKVDVVDRDARVIYECVQSIPSHDLIPTDIRDNVVATVKKNVSTRHVTPPAQTNTRRAPTSVAIYNGRGAWEWDSAAARADRAAVWGDPDFFME